MFNQLKAAASQFSSNKTNTANTNTNTAQGNSTAAQGTTAAGGEPDALDKGIEFISGKLGMKSVSPASSLLLFSRKG